MADAPGPEPTASPPDPPEHDPAGLDLAQAMVKSFGARRRRRPRPPSPPADPRVSGARPDDRDPKRLADAFEQLVDSKGWSAELSVHTVLARWSSLVGPVNAQHAWPESYTGGVLVVRAESTVWATSLRSMAPQLVARLNAEIGEGTVTRVQVLGPDGPSWKHGRRSVRDGRGPRDTYG
jgi:predicted nucleic acid-binding Zn ribbon protein